MYGFRVPSGHENRVVCPLDRSRYIHQTLRAEGFFGVRLPYDVQYIQHSRTLSIASVTRRCGTPERAAHSGTTESVGQSIRLAQLLGVFLPQVDCDPANG